METVDVVRVRLIGRVDCHVIKSLFWVIKDGPSKVYAIRSDATGEYGLVAGRLCCLQHEKMLKRRINRVFGGEYKWIWFCESLQDNKSSRNISIWRFLFYYCSTRTSNEYIGDDYTHKILAQEIIFAFIERI